MLTSPVNNMAKKTEAGMEMSADKSNVLVSNYQNVQVKIEMTEKQSEEVSALKYPVPGWNRTRRGNFLQ